jgi:hypothetical protein
MLAEADGPYYFFKQLSEGNIVSPQMPKRVSKNFSGNLFTGKIESRIRRSKNWETSFLKLTSK